MILLDDLLTAPAPCFGQCLEDPLLGGRRGRNITSSIIRAGRIKTGVAGGTELIQDQALGDSGEMVEGIHKLGRLRFKGPEQQIVDPSHESDVSLALCVDGRKECCPFTISQTANVLLRGVENVSVAADLFL